MKMKNSRKAALAVAGVIGVAATLSVSSPALATDVFTTGSYNLCLPSIDSTAFTVSNSTPGDHLVWAFSEFTDVAGWVTQFIPGKYIDLGPSVDGEYAVTNESARALAQQVGVTAWPFELALVISNGPYGPTDTPTPYRYDYTAVGVDTSAPPYTVCDEPVMPEAELEADELPDTGTNEAETLSGVVAAVALTAVGVALVLKRRRSRA
jgi:LPXTG-motif cell wall-anchored protein